jgi:hypothetical protein
VLDYTVSTIVPITAPAVLLESTGIDDIGPAWTQLPAALPDRVVQLARRITAKAASREAQVTAVTSYLRSHETYSLDSPVPGVNEDAVDRFLFRDHVGFCEQFASAAVVLVRAVGVPARVVTGLAYGHQVGTGRLYTAADAHAWVEVHYPGVGWSPIDPTAGVALATATGSGSGRWAWLHRLTTSVPAGLPGATTIVALLAAGAVVATRRRRLHSAPAGDAIDSGPVLAAFRRYVRWRRQPRQLSETAREYVERLKATDQLRDAVTILEHECYGAMSPVDSETARAVAAFTDSSSNR